MRLLYSGDGDQSKALLDKNPEPSRRDIKEALRGNICRCTGYVKIEKAIELSAEALRSGLKRAAANCQVGARMPRVDALEKTLGAVCMLMICTLMVCCMAVWCAPSTRVPSSKALISRRRSIIRAWRRF